MVEKGADENVIMQEDCSEDQIGSGYLTLTSKRIIFQTGEARMLTLSKKMTDIVLEIPLINVKDVRSEGWLAKKVVVEVDKDLGGKLYKFGVFSTGKWRDAIDSAKATNSSK